MAEIQLSVPVVAISGRVGNSQMVFYTSRGRSFVRAFTPPSGESSADQAAVRAHLSASARQWSQLTDAQRTGWQNYATRWYAVERQGKLVTPSGSQVYSKVAFYRLALGLGLPAEAPTTSPPAPLGSMTDVPAGDATEFSFGITHGIASVTGYRLLARITPQVPAGRAPRTSDLRYVAGVNEASFITLPVSGATATFTGARFSIPENGRFLAELTVLSADSAPSLPLHASLTHHII